jgi:hypothetical protein
MAYYDVALLHSDADFLLRVAACYTTEPDTTEDPDSWAALHAWDIASAPGFGDAYASALASGVEQPGADQSVISDNQILGAVQYLLAQPLASASGSSGRSLSTPGSSGRS